MPSMSLLGACFSVFFGKIILDIFSGKEQERRKTWENWVLFLPRVDP